MVDCLKGNVICISFYKCQPVNFRSRKRSSRNPRAVVELPLQVGNVIRWGSTQTQNTVAAMQAIWIPPCKTRRFESRFHFIFSKIVHWLDKANIADVVSGRRVFGYSWIFGWIFVNIRKYWLHLVKLRRLCRLMGIWICLVGVLIRLQLLAALVAVRPDRDHGQLG